MNGKTGGVLWIDKFLGVLVNFDVFRITFLEVRFVKKEKRRDVSLLTM